MSNLELISKPKNLGTSVGSLIWKNEEKKELLVQYRLSHPVGLACPAGHIEEGEAPSDANKREDEEEVGIAVANEDQKEILHKTYPNPCGKGHDAHEWWVYEVTKFSGEPRLVEHTKHKFVQWMSWDEILEYIARNDVDPAWIMIFRDLGMLK
jgi:8-oxo-dGTP pyrophosphatase MutT (NUDIX family)